MSCVNMQSKLLINLQEAKKTVNTQLRELCFFREVVHRLLVGENISEDIFPFHSRQRFPTLGAH